MIIFTSICANYGHKARLLAESVRRQIPDAVFYLCLVEREVPAVFREWGCFDHIVLAREIWGGNFDRFIFKHAIVEASTAVKGAFLRWLQLQHPEEDMFLYLDPDCFVYSDFPELREALRRKPAVLCPHLLHPGNIDMELSSTAHGVYNLVFLAVNNSEAARTFVQWWADRLYLFCYDDIQQGIFTDQKWMDLAPCFFDVEIFHHYGYDFAPWGLQGTRVERRDGNWLIQGMPLRFIHYSGFGRVARECMEKWMDESGKGFQTLYTEYERAHAEADRDHISRTPWSYAAYHSGEPVSDSVRQRYRQDWDLMFAVEDPFAQSNAWFERALGNAEKASRPTLINRVRWKAHRAKEVYRDEGGRGVLALVRKKLTGSRATE